MGLKINPKFRDVIPPLSTEEYEQLEKNILKDGIREPLVIWGETLVDGHNRYRIALKHNLKFDVQTMAFEDEDDVVIWISWRQKHKSEKSTGKGKLYRRRQGIFR